MKLKNILIIIACVFSITILFFEINILLNNKKHGDISKVNIVNVPSKIYSDNDIQSAIDVALNYFKEHYKGCIMAKISYIGDEKNNEYIDWARRNNKEEVMVVISEFITTESSGPGLNPNSKYTNYNWILIRNKDGKWQHADHGY